MRFWWPNAGSPFCYNSCSSPYIFPTLLLHLEEKRKKKTCSHEHPEDFTPYIQCFPSFCTLLPLRALLRHISCGSVELHARIGSEETQDSLVHAKHDGSAGHDSEHMRYETTVQSSHTLFLPDQLEALCQTSVFELWYAIN